MPTIKPEVIPEPMAASSSTLPHAPSLPDTSQLNAALARSRFFLAVSTALAAFLLYSICLSSTVTYGGDCGELIAASYRLGIAHPTGYPLYCLLGRTFASLLPLGEVGWRYNVLSALCGAAAAGFVTATVHRLTVFTVPTSGAPARLVPAQAWPAQAWPALGAGLLLGGSYSLGSQSVIAEVYALNALMLSALFYSALAWHQDADWRWAYTLALLFGLALVTHLSCVFAAPGLLLYVVWQHRARFSEPGASRAFRWIVLLALPLAACALLLYLPLRSQLFPEPPRPQGWWPLDWSHPVDFGRWFAHISAKQYKRFLIEPHTIVWAGRSLQVPWFAQSPAMVPGKLFSTFQLVAAQYLWATPFLFWGALASFAGRRTPSPTNRGEPSHQGGHCLGLMLLLTLVLNIGIQINYKVGDVANFFFPAYIVMALWMGLGLAAFFRALDGAAARLGATAARALWQWRFTTLARLLLLGTIVVQWVFFVPAVSVRGLTTARDSALEYTDAATLLTRQAGHAPWFLLYMNDNLWTYWYVHYVLQRGPQVRMWWGRELTDIVDSGHLVELVAKLQASGPVALSQWDARTDARFPYEPLTPSGNLCLAAPRLLPSPAVTVDASRHETLPLSNGLRRARFRRTRFRRDRAPRVDVADGGESDSDGLPAEEVTALRRAGLVSLKRGDMARFIVDFEVSPAMIARLRQASEATKTLDAKHATGQAGWIEVLMAQHGFLARPPIPAQGTIQAPGSFEPALPVWKQTRRLILPLSLLRSPASTRSTWRAVAPLQIEGNALTSAYDVWARLTTSPHDTSTPWQRTDIVRLTHK